MIWLCVKETPNNSGLNKISFCPSDVKVRMKTLQGSVRGFPSSLTGFPECLLSYPESVILSLKFQVSHGRTSRPPEQDGGHGKGRHHTFPDVAHIASSQSTEHSHLATGRQRNVATNPAKCWQIYFCARRSERLLRRQQSASDTFFFLLNFSTTLIF